MAVPGETSETINANASQPAITITELARSNPRAAGLDPDAVADLLRRANESGSDTLIVLVDGKIAIEEYFDHPRSPIEAMSATKSVVALAIGRLIDQCGIAALDTPVHELYPEWRQGNKREIAIRHLLSHTSGLQNARTTDVEIYPSPDFVKLALAAEVESAPGSVFSYNNKAVNLLAGIVERASGQRMDRYIAGEIFEPLGITDFGWTLDRSGNPHAMSGLQIHAIDLAKIGLLVLGQGSYRGRRLLSPQFVAQAMRPQGSGDCGLLWWLTPEKRVLTITPRLVERWRAAGAEPEFITRIEPLVGREFDRQELVTAVLELFPSAEDRKVWDRNIHARSLPDSEVIASGEILAYRAEGYLGQHVVIVPAARIVAVRQKRGSSDPSQVDAMLDFPDLVVALAQRAASLGSSTIDVTSSRLGTHRSPT